MLNHHFNAKIFSLVLFTEKIKKSCCIPFPVSSISVPVHSFSDVLKYHRLNQSEISFKIKQYKIICFL